MNGLEKILKDISDNAQSECDKILDEAKKNVGDIISEAKKQAEKISASEEIKLQLLSEDLNKRAESGAGLEKRRLILFEKQKIISDIIQKAYNKLLLLSDKEYFDVLMKLAENNIQAENGEILFNEKDKKRIPKGFVSQLNQKADKIGGRITLSAEAADIDGGFLLVYGGIEENCSFSSLFHSNNDALKDIVSKIIFE